MTIAMPDGSAAGFSVLRFPTRAHMAEAAAADIAGHLRHLLAAQGGVRMIAASAPSQEHMLAALARQPGIDWRRVMAFHMDEYIGLPADHPARFGNWLGRHFFGRVPLGAVHLMRPRDDDPEAEAESYAALLGAAPIDLVCLGIGVSGHIAFNDPPVADFADPLRVKVVLLHAECRQQQVDDECFARLEDVPRRAVTITVTGLLSGARLFAVVPGRAKREAVRRALHGPIATSCPASILRTHPGRTLYLDRESDPDA